MYRKYLIAIIILFQNTCLAQDRNIKPFLSTEVLFTTPHYLTGYDNQFNYGGGLLFSFNTRGEKASTGIIYATKKYSFKQEEYSTQYSLEYFNIPFLLNFNILPPENIKNKLFITSGFIFNIPFNYHSETVFSNGKESIKNQEPSDYENGMSWRLGLLYQKRLNQVFSVTTSIYTDYKFHVEEFDFEDLWGPQYHEPSYSKDRFLIGLSLGMEWRYGSNE